MRIFAALTSLIFAYFAYLQHNDPDPYLWIPLYLAVSISALVRYFRPLPKIWVGMGCLGYLVYSTYVATTVPDWGFDNEETRECLGLLLAGIFLFFLGKEKKQLA